MAVVSDLPAMLAPGPLALVLGIAGALIGSYLGTIVMRWPNGRSASTGRSACDGCDRVLRWYELVPVFSALFSAMRCRRCGARIDPVHFIAELIASVMAALGALVLPFQPALAFALMVWILVPLALLDARHFWLPDRLTLLLSGVGLFAGYWLGLASDIDRLIGGFAGFASLWLIGAGYRRWRGHDGLGAGDAKLLGALGLWMGWQALPWLLVVGTGAGLLHALFLMARGQASNSMRMPFGLYLAISAMVVPLTLGSAS